MNQTCGQIMTIMVSLSDKHHTICHEDCGKTGDDCEGRDVLTLMLHFGVKFMDLPKILKKTAQKASFGHVAMREVMYLWAARKNVIRLASIRIAHPSKHISS